MASPKWLALLVGLWVVTMVGCDAAADIPPSPLSPTAIPPTPNNTPTISSTPVRIPTEPHPSTTNAVSPTITDLPSDPTPEISPTSSPEPTPTPDLTSRLFTFFAVGGFDYGWQEPLTGLAGRFDPSDFGLTPYVIGAAATLSFAHYSNQVAIWSRLPDEPGKLWLADIALQQIILIYLDDHQI